MIPLASMCLQCTQPLTFTYGLLDRRLFHPHRLRSTVKVIRASFSQIRIAPRARPHRTHRSCTDFRDFAAGEQDPLHEGQVSPTIDYLLDQGLRGDRRAGALRHKIKVCLDDLKQACSPGNKEVVLAIGGSLDDI